MDDMISRQAAIKAFKDSLTIHDSRGAEYLCSAVTMDGVNRILSDLPSVQPEHLVKESGNLVNGLVNDCISRQAAIDAVCEYCKYCEYFYNEKVIQSIKEIPSAQPDMSGNMSGTQKELKCTETHDWIPVTERLPEDACQCIVTAKVKHVDNYPDYEVDTADFADGIFTTANSWWGVESIIAWMPLPEPWKGEQDGTT